MSKVKICLSNWTLYWHTCHTSIYACRCPIRNEHRTRHWYGMFRLYRLWGRPKV